MMEIGKELEIKTKGEGKEEQTGLQIVQNSSFQERVVLLFLLEVQWW